jgi:hypothetical protein
MSAVTGFHRLSILAIAALLAAGCGASPASPSAPPSQGSASASPVGTSEPIPTASPGPDGASPPATSPEPSTTACPTDVGDDNPMVTLSAAEAFWMQLSIKEMAPLAAPDQPMAPPNSPSRWGALEFLLGGGETRLDLEYYPVTWPAAPITISKLRLTLQADGQDPVGLSVRLEPGAEATRIFVDVPDITWSGTLEIVAEWQDPCFTYRARSTAPLLIDPASSVTSCSTRRSPAFEELDVTFEPPIRVGPVDANLQPHFFNGKVTSLAVIDPLPPYTGFTRDTVTFAADWGATVGISSWSDEVELWLQPGAEVSFFRRGELIRWMEGGWIHGDEPEAEVVFSTPLVQVADGFTFKLPAEPGRYAVTAGFNYNSACSFGTAGFVVGVDVVAVASQ